MLEGGAWNGKAGSIQSNSKDLSDELEALSEKQSDARQTEVYIRMTPQEIKDFDTRKQRISAIYIVLSNHDANR